MMETEEKLTKNRIGFLSPDEYKVAVLTLQENLKQVEVAKRLGVGQSNVSQHWTTVKEKERKAEETLEIIRGLRAEQEGKK